MNRFPYDNSPEFPRLRFGNFDKGSRLSMLVIPDPNGTNRQVVDRHLPFCELGMRRKAYALLGLRPRYVTFRKAPAFTLNAGTIREPKTALRAELRSINVGRLEAEQSPAVFARLNHLTIVTPVMDETGEI